MNINKTGLPLAIHRKKSVSFRDKSLLQIFQVAMQTLGQLLSGTYGQITPLQVLVLCVCAMQTLKGQLLSGTYGQITPSRYLPNPKP